MLCSDFYSFPVSNALKYLSIWKRQNLVFAKLFCHKSDYLDGMISSTSSCANVTEHCGPQDSIVGVKNRQLITIPSESIYPFAVGTDQYLVLASAMTQNVVLYFNVFFLYVLNLNVAYRYFKWEVRWPHG